MTTLISAFRGGKRRSIWTFIFLSFVLFSAFPSYAPAQELYARIKGVVTDATGAPVPEAQVKATNSQTGVSSTVPSAADGSFQFLQLPVGTYNVSVTKSGFTSFAENGILLVLNQVYSLPVTLQVGQVSQSVEVQASPAQVETTTTQLGTVIEARKIVDLPLNGRNWTTLQQLVPGVVAASDTNRFNFATNGSQSQQNSFLLNGVDNIDLPLNEPSIIPSPDAIAEFNLIDSTINPEYGRNSGAILNAIIKSGTNDFHGSAFEFYRDTFLNGRNLFQQSAPVFHQNQFGGTLGGPVWKNHTFFFVSYQGTRFRQPESGVSQQTTVFNGSERNGLFPDIAASSGTSPFRLTGENGVSYPAGTPYSTIFPTGHIPTADFNSISSNLLSKYVPLPNAPGNQYSFNPLTAGTQDQGIARIDHTFNPQNAVWGALTIEHTPNTQTLPFNIFNTGSTLPGFGQINTEDFKQATADWTHTFNASTLNEFRIAYLRFNYNSVAPQNPALPSTFGFTGINPQGASVAGAPVVAITGFFDLGFSANGPQPRIDETYEITDSFSKVVANHTLKIGFDGKRYNVDNPFYGNNNGTFTFGGNGQYSTGNPGADFLLGIPDSYSQGSGGWIVARSYEYYSYVQDSWRVRPNLTLNYGAGYQIDTPLVNQHFNGLDVNCFRPGQQSSVFPTAPQGLLFPGDQGCSSSGYYNHYDHVGPRFGFAYSPGSSADKKFVIRGGFGIYFNRSEEELTLQNLGAVPFALTSTGIGDALGSPSFANPFTDIATGQSIPNKFPFVPAKKGSNVDFSNFEPLSINVVNPDFTSPYAMNFNFNVQHELPGAMILQVGYVGALGRHLELTYEGNPISPAGAAACAADPACVTDKLFQHRDYPSHAQFAPGDIFGSIGTQATLGVSSYNSLQVSLNKHLNHGLTFLAAYTWSHSIDDTSSYETSSNGIRGLNPYNFALNKGDSSYDARQRFVISYDYAVPRVSRFWNNSVTRTVLDGWHLAGITTLQTGFPILMADSEFRSLTCDTFNYGYGCWDAPNLVSSPTSLDPRTSSEVNSTKGAQSTAKPYYWFNPNDFSREAIGVLGNEGRNNFHGPGINNTDLVLSKRMYLDSESKRFIELRLEGYNVFNHTQFSPISTAAGGSGVNGDLNSSNFGRVLAAASGRTIQLGAKFYF